MVDLSSCASFRSSVSSNGESSEIVLVNLPGRILGMSDRYSDSDRPTTTGCYKFCRNFDAIFGKDDDTDHDLVLTTLGQGAVN